MEIDTRNMSMNIIMKLGSIFHKRHEKVRVAPLAED